MPSYRCPKCSATINGEPDSEGVVTCAQCGVKLRARPPASAPSATPAPPPPEVPSPVPAAPTPPPPAPRPPAVDLDAVLAEIRAVRAAQDEILALLRSRLPVDTASSNVGFGMGADDEPPPPTPAPAAPVRSRRRKTVLLIDDDPATTKDTVAALTAAEVPVRAIDDGNAALAAIAAEKPDVIAIEHEMGGVMAGKDVINMIKATMEWVDIPIVLYTRAPVASQKEARQIHGADELVLKSEGPAALVARAIAIFRK